MQTSNKKLKLDVILESNEWWPKDNDPDWTSTKINDKDIQIITKIKGTQEFKINNNLKNTMKQFNKIMEEIDYKLDIKYNETKSKVYTIMDKKTKHFYCGYTRMDVLTSIKSSLHHYFNANYSVLYNFEAPLSELNLSVKIEEIVNSTDRIVLRKRVKYYHDKYNKNNIIDFTTMQKFNLFLNIYKIYMLKEKDLFGKMDNTVEFYALANNKNKKRFIGYISKKIIKPSKGKIMKDLLKSNAKFKKEYTTKDDYSLEKLPRSMLIDNNFKFDYYLNCDYYIVKYDAIKNGYNTNYYLFNEKFSPIKKLEKIYLIVQKEVSLMNNYNDISDDTIEIIYKMEDKDKKVYIGRYKKKGEHNNILKEAMRELYDNAINDKDRFSKISRALGKYPVNDWDIEVIEEQQNNTEKNMNSLYDTYINNYNSHEDYNEKLAKKKRAVYMYKR